MPAKTRELPQVDTADLIDQAQRLPESPGVYHFLNKDAYPVYIGKSINLKQRALSHLYAANRDSKENKIARSATHIHYETTPGELGALIQESLQVKKFLPLYNRQLRRQKKLYTWKLDETNLYHSLTLTEAIWPPPHGVHYFGLYRSAFHAKNTLEKLATDQNLCKKLLGFERLRSTCFAYQLKKCLGACKGLESSESYNARLRTTLQNSAVNLWPFPGPIGVIEEQANFAYIFDQWNYLGTSSTQQLNDHTVSYSITDEHILDRDTYRILLSSLTKKIDGLNIVALSAVK